MRIEVVGRNIEVTPAIREHAEGRALKLPKFFNGVMQVTFTLHKADHHKHGSFGAEMVIGVQHHEDFVSHATGNDLYAIIDEVAHKGERQLRDFKDRLKG